jgi:hypothetical protein
LKTGVPRRSRCGTPVLSIGLLAVRLHIDKPARAGGKEAEVKYLLLLQRAAGEDLPEFGTPEAAAMVSAWTSATDAMRTAGVLIDCAPLASASVATTVRVRDGQTLLTDGPAAELKEQVGGYTLMECADLDEAIKWAASLPAAAAASVEIRPVISPSAPDPGTVPGASAPASGTPN